MVFLIDWSPQRNEMMNETEKTN